MKKLLALVMVLSVASLATAGLSVMADGGPTFGLEQDTAGSLDFYVVVDSALGADLTYENVIGGDLSSSSDYDALFGDAFDPTDLGVSGLPTTSAYVELVTIASSTGPVPAGLWANITVDGAMFGQGDVAAAWIVDSGTSEVLATAYLVPEPATMALLGLGALVLRRKK